MGRGSIFGFALATLVLVCTLSVNVFASHPGFDPNNLITDGEFVDVNNMSVDEIQRFLSKQGSYLKDYSEDGKTAAQIIADSARGVFRSQNLIDFVPTASIKLDSSTGTVNPKVILVTLQKEQSLISKTTKDDNALRKAMGYGCPDSGSCSSEYAGFTKQVEWGSWQLRFNYERAKDSGFSDYQVGQSLTVSNADSSSTTVTFSNRATASLYRYTPHVYNGNHNFNNLYVNTYNFQVREYEAQSAGWSSSDGDFTAATIVRGGDATNLVIRLKNTGRTSWTQDLVYLGTSGPRDRTPGFVRESGMAAKSGWVSPNRVQMLESSVEPGQIATFNFWLRALESKPTGTYRERFELVADGISWFPIDLGIFWDINVISNDQAYKAEPAGWSSSNGDYVHPTISRGGAGTNLVFRLKNTGKTPWTQDIVHLGTFGPRDRIAGFVRESGSSNLSGWDSPNRVKMQENQVNPGQIATFNFWIRALPDKQPGTYIERFAPVADGVTWFSEDIGIFWEIKVD